MQQGVSSILRIPVKSSAGNVDFDGVLERAKFVCTFWVLRISARNFSDMMFTGENPVRRVCARGRKRLLSSVKKEEGDQIFQ